MLSFIKSSPVTIGVIVAALLAFAFPVLCDQLEYQTQWQALVQIPNLFGCHLLHWNGQHLFWDLMMFAVLAGMCERLNANLFRGALVTAAAVIPVSVQLWQPEIESYRGLSGIDTALFGMFVAFNTLDSWRRRDRSGVLIYGTLFAAMIMKTWHEVTSGDTLFVESADFSPVPIAHIAGGAVGVLFGSIWFVIRLISPRNGLTDTPHAIDGAVSGASPS